MKNQAANLYGIPLDPIPAPTLALQRFMLATALLIDGVLETSPEQFHPYLQHSFLVPQAGVIIVGTRCDRPLMLREVGNIASAVQRDGLIVRTNDNPNHATFDVVLHGSEHPLCAYRLWMPQPSGPAWLVPSAGEPDYVRLDPLGLELAEEPPFGDEVERYRGLKFASEFLSVAAQGWF